MGLFSGLVKAGIAAAKVINNADSISDIIDKAPEILGKAKETVVKIQDVASTVDLHVQSKKQEKEKLDKQSLEKQKLQQEQNKIESEKRAIEKERKIANQTVLEY